MVAIGKTNFNYYCTCACVTTRHYCI